MKRHKLRKFSRIEGERLCRDFRKALNVCEGYDSDMAYSIAYNIIFWADMKRIVEVKLLEEQGIKEAKDDIQSDVTVQWACDTRG